MNLLVLGPMVALGIALVVFLVHTTGGSKTLVLRDADDARARFLHDYPDLKAHMAVLTHDRDAAVIALEAPGFGLIRALGNRFVTRLVDAAALARPVRMEGTTVEIAMKDFTFPKAQLAFSDAEAARAAARITANAVEKAS
jgi:hypothetical protein